MITTLGNWNCLIEAKSRYTFAYKKIWKCHNRILIFRYQSLTATYKIFLALLEIPKIIIYSLKDSMVSVGIWTFISHCM